MLWHAAAEHPCEDRRLCLEEAQHNRCDVVDGSWEEQTMARQRKHPDAQGWPTDRCPGQAPLSMRRVPGRGALADACVEQYPVVSRMIAMRADESREMLG